MLQCKIRENLNNALQGTSFFLEVVNFSIMVFISLCLYLLKVTDMLSTETLFLIITYGSIPIVTFNLIFRFYDLSKIDIDVKYVKVKKKEFKMKFESLFAQKVFNSVKEEAEKIKKDLTVSSLANNDVQQFMLDAHIRAIEVASCMAMDEYKMMEDAEMRNHFEKERLRVESMGSKVMGKIAIENRDISGFDRIPFLK